MGIQRWQAIRRIGALRAPAGLVLLGAALWAVPSVFASAQAPQGKDYMPQDVNVPYQNPMFKEIWQSIMPALDAIADDLMAHRSAALERTYRHGRDKL